MTSREPTPDLRITLLEERVADFTWALGRMVELVAEADKSLAESIVSRVAAENTVRNIQRNVDSTPLSG